MKCAHQCPKSKLKSLSLVLRPLSSPGGGGGGGGGGGRGVT